MSKYIVAVFAALLSCTPAISLAQGVGQINGNGQASQKLATTTGVTTMHMDIITNQGVHTFQWDNTPWRVDQGGTGQSSFTAGALLYGNGTSPLGETAIGNQGDILQFNGTLPTWVSPSSLGISAQPAGSDGEIQFNNNGNFGSDANLKWDGALAVTGNASFQSPSDPRFGIFIKGDGSGIEFGNAVGPTGSTAIYEDAYGTLALQGAASTTPIRLTSNDGQGSVKLDLHLLVGGDWTLTFPNESGTFGLLEADQKWTGTNTFSKGTAATTTVSFGEIGDTTSHVCFNTKNTDGQDISFYFVGTSMVVENNVCQ